MKRRQQQTCGCELILDGDLIAFSRVCHQHAEEYQKALEQHLDRELAVLCEAPEPHGRMH